MNWRRIYSFAHLALEFWIRQIRRLWRGRRDNGGLERFLLNFGEDGLLPLTQEQEESLLGASRCIHCGFCEAVCPIPIDLWMKYSRALSLAPEAARSSPPGCGRDCQLCEEHCPVGVPIHRISAVLRRDNGRS